jgi:hypothetical protein
MTSRGWVLRLVALLAAGTFGVHQGRYALGYREEASRALAAQGHAYLIALGPLAAVAVMVALAALIRRVARGGGGATPAPRVGHLWASVTLALVAAYAAQESIEGALAAHHPAGAAGILGHGGWVVLPLALAAGLAIALAMRGASAAADLGRPRRPWRAPTQPPPRTLAMPHRTVAPRAGAPLAHAARGPPLLAF